VLRPARLACLAFAAAVISVPLACGLDVVGSAPLAESTTTPDGTDGGVLDDGSMGGGDATQGGCTDGRTVCSGTCTDTTADPANCGGCGMACAVGQTCNAGTCDVLCVGDTIRCAGACVDPSSDPANCGKCGNACGAGLPVCVSKSCEADCKADQTRCSPDAGAGDGGALTYCATTMTDRNNCGACGKVCTVNQSCVAGTCKDLCQSPARVGDVFSPTMVGCVDKRTWNNRAQSCPAGTTVCTPAQWNARPAGSKPTFNYWTNDYLEYKGSSSNCVAVPQNTGGGSCYGDPMRVCGAKTDQAGNSCNWTNCGYGTVSPNQYFGGCQNNAYAGALCCSP
jgi:hypothetical protein